jgi:hypothetical protein
MASLQVGTGGGVGFCFVPLDGGRRRARRAALRPPRASAAVAEDQDKVRLGESSVAVSKLGIGAWSWGDTTYWNDSEWDGAYAACTLINLCTIIAYDELICVHHVLNTEFELVQSVDLFMMN